MASAAELAGGQSFSAPNGAKWPHLSRIRLLVVCQYEDCEAAECSKNNTEKTLTVIKAIHFSQNYCRDPRKTSLEPPHQVA